MTTPTAIDRIRQSAPLILPSLLLCDFRNLEREVRQLEEAGVQALHLDVMDGLFVPNMTYGFPIVQAFRQLTDMPLDVHLMIERPERYIKQFCDAGSDVITIHVESTEDAPTVLQQIRQAGVASGIALNPETPLEQIKNCLDHSDLALVMSVNAGFGGQKFNTVALDKLRQLKEWNPDLLLEVDGGINDSTIAQCAEAGARMFVVGSAIFRKDDYKQAMSQLTTLTSS